MRPVDVEALLAALGIEAKRNRRSHWATCPIHGERTPSWSMNDDPGDRKHGWWSCFACKASGDPATLVGMLLGLDRDDAKAWLASYETDPIVPQRVVLEETVPARPLEVPNGVIVEPFARWPSKFREYLEARGVEAWQVDQWGFGWAVEGPCAGRVWIPVRDERGRLRTWTARGLGPKEPRYLKPRRGDGADPDAIFGAERWGDAMTVVVVEGVFDALAAERTLVKIGRYQYPTGTPVGVAVAALLGSRVADAHCRALARFSRAIVATDGDAAGDGAAAALAGLRLWESAVRLVVPGDLADTSATLRRSAIAAALEAVDTSAGSAIL